ncbi:PadR family transcriptional regulator [Mobiluncus mulieris]|uniref:PadR family transcriptional regulator n=1 Tax=Mobiluncus mulieris TaxID=2052 RepID=A0A7Y0Y387_9ACTO|nr:PadR family transcriptional regulator [Mobiluncus mulieris]MCU9972896.1 PadR family transcriptional regulator [Mobiluncus mulieris]MCU9995812.1 PadR family transcriptional regulator [Mobiluncus mulieris]MCV0009136.1 PadR family transcriptional regulator [Mobiluncus mulieris]MCV0011071.1 PadR family transcriptional regulator [Mobiluncus mulieris]NMW64010.1 PadR family transcriptional regulator [Mobiluncus mulieris]
MQDSSVSGRKDIVVAENAGGMLTQLRKGVLEYCVLRHLDDKPAYGLELANLLSDQGLIAHGGSLYPLLTRLRTQGLVETFWEESESGPPRRYYRQTAEGHTALRKFCTEWRDFTSKVDKLMEGIAS